MTETWTEQIAAVKHAPFDGKDGKPVDKWVVTFVGGKEAQTFSENAAKPLEGAIGQSLEVEVEEGKEFRGQKQFKVTKVSKAGAVLYEPQAKKGGGKPFGKSPEERASIERQTALIQAVASFAHPHQGLAHPHEPQELADLVLGLASRYLAFLQDKTPDKEKQSGGRAEVIHAASPSSDQADPAGSDVVRPSECSHPEWVPAPNPDAAARGFVMCAVCRDVRVPKEKEAVS